MSLDAGMADRELSKSSAKAYGFESHSRHISTCGETGKHDGLKIHFRQRITSSSLVGCIFLGVAKLVSRLFWEQETASSSLVAQTITRIRQADKAVEFDSTTAGSIPASSIYMRIWWNGRHARFRIWCFGVWVRCPLSAPRS